MRGVRAVCVGVCLALAGCGGSGDEPARACPTAQQLSGDIREEVVIGDECSNWLATGDIRVLEGGKLIVRRGTTLVFPKDAMLQILGGGALVIEGTEEANVFLTGAQKTRGFWKGVHFDATAADNRISYTNIAFAGFRWDGAGARAGLSLTTGAKVALEHVNVREIDGYGLHLCGDCVAQPFVANSFEKTTEGAAFVYPTALGQLSSDSSYLGSDVDRIYVPAGEVGDLHWRALGAPYHVETVKVLGHVSIDPGAKLAFTQGGALEVTSTGSLTAEAPPESPILLTGVERTRGFWKGLSFHGTAPTGNALKNVVVEFAGREKFENAAAPAGISLSGNAQVSIRNVTVQETAGFGIDLVDGVVPSPFSGNVFSANALGAANVGIQSAQYLLGTNTYSGNDIDDIPVTVSGEITTAMTWQKLDVPLRIQGDVEVATGGHLNLAPGVTIYFDENASLVADGGAITAIGTPTARITLTRAPGVTTAFRGVGFRATTDPANRLEFVDILHGGGSKFYAAEDVGNLVVMQNAAVRVSDVTLAHSAGWGLVISAQSEVTGCGGMTFSDNASGDSTRACPYP